MSKIAVLLFFFAACFLVSCAPKSAEKPEFLEFRLHRWTALEGGETLVVRRLGNEWSAILLGNGDRFSCLYQKSVKPKSEWQKLWDEILAKGLNAFPDGYKADYIVEDGDGFDLEVMYQGRLTRVSIPHPESQNSPIAKQILELSDYLGQEFDTPVFIAKYDRGKVGEYLIDNCKDLRK